MNLIWGKIAFLQLKQVAKYIESNFGTKRKNTFLKEVNHITDLLLENPYIGALDEALSHRLKQYRSIVIGKKNKMVYYIDSNNTIHISAFWDCRRNEQRQTSHLI